MSIVRNLLFAFSYLIINCQFTHAIDTGIGFGWEASASNEVIYQINLTSGASTAIGTIPELETVVVGSHNVDYSTGTAVMAGSKGGSNADTLFFVIPKTRTVFSFKIKGIDAESTIQRALIRPSDGAVFVLISENRGTELHLYQVTFNAVLGEASLLHVETLFSVSYTIDGIKMADNGVIYILVAGGANDGLFSINTLTKESSSAAIPSIDHQGLFACSEGNTAPKLFSFRSSRVNNPVTTTLNEITLSGTDTEVLTGVNLTSIAGSYSCTNNTLRLLSLDGSALSLASLNGGNPGAGFQSLPLDQNTLKFLGITKANIAAERPQISANAAKKFQLFSPAAVKKCVKELGSGNVLSKKKNAGFRAIAKGLLKVRKSNGKCTT